MSNINCFNVTPYTSMCLPHKDMSYSIQILSGDNFIQLIWQSIQKSGGRVSLKIHNLASASYKIIHTST